MKHFAKRVIALIKNRMKEQTFISNRYGKTSFFSIGQKVEVTYYHEYNYIPNEYHDSFFKSLFDKPFTPVKLGMIVGDAGIRSYWLAKDGKEQFLWVRFKECRFDKAIPISCIEDALVAAQRMEIFLRNGEKYLGERGYSYESFGQLTKQMNDAKAFVNK